MNDKNQNSLNPDMEKILVVLMIKPASTFPVNQSLIQRKALNLFSSLKAERGEEAAEEKFEASRGWFMKFKKHFHTIKVQGKASRTNVEAAANCPDYHAKVIDEDG